MSLGILAVLILLGWMINQFFVLPFGWLHVPAWLGWAIGLWLLSWFLRD
ncbi:hypothetical protein [Pantanalinema sp. GBBB05]